MIRLRILFALLTLLRTGGHALADEDSRQPVDLPAPMKEHMLSNMRDHLRTLEAMLAALARGDAKSAAEEAEMRIGMSSLDAHGAAHMAPFMPEPMRQMGTAMHRAASRFRIAAESGELEPPEKAAAMTHGALSEILGTCNACHSVYRLR
jgi:hypothetical protein